MEKRETTLSHFASVDEVKSYCKINGLDMMSRDEFDVLLAVVRRASRPLTFAIVQDLLMQYRMFSNVFEYPTPT